ncbi:MAG: helix-hairpin-helix domain-containing protein [Prevotella sp.]|nr:helix-hairpin-helix domain-containing protein [Prevotella sp.]
MNRNDRLILIVTIITGVLILLGIFLLGGERPEDAQMRNEKLGMRNGNGEMRKNGRYIPYDEGLSPSKECFYFDPNTADSTELLRLGLQPWQVRNIYRYRAKGGVYQKKEDFARLYGLTVKDYRRLEPYIRISEDYLPASTLVGNYGGPSRTSGSSISSRTSGFRRDSLHYPVKIREGEHVVLNSADTAMLRKVPGIGAYYAKEIVRYGRWLGGFVSVDQLDEIDNFPQGAKKYFVIEHPHPQKLNINKLTLQQLRRHPYINYYQAKAITDYRRLHGDIKSLQDLRFSPDFTEQDIQRLTPYIEY